MKMKQQPEDERPKWKIMPDGELIPAGAIEKPKEPEPKDAEDYHRAINNGLNLILSIIEGLTTRK